MTLPLATMLSTIMLKPASSVSLSTHLPKQSSYLERACAGNPVHKHSAAVAAAGAHRRRHNPHVSVTNRLERPEGDCGIGARVVHIDRPRHRQRCVPDAGLLLDVDNPCADCRRAGQPLWPLASGERPFISMDF